MTKRAAARVPLEEGPGLPQPFAGCFAARGWRPHPHQLALLEAA